MRVLVVGAGRTGANVIRQLQKNPSVEIIVVDPRPDAYAVRHGVIPAVDILEAFTPLTLDYVLNQAKAELVLLATTSEDLGLGNAPGIDVLADALREELSANSEIPVITVARSGR